MLAFLGNILAALENMPTLIIDGVDQVINGLFAAIAAFLGILFSLLPSMPSPGSLVLGQWVNWLNWFYPIGDVLAAMAVGITMYVVYLGVRYALNLVRAL